jgi:hypothetical protein
LVGSLLFISVALAQDRLYVFQEGTVRSKMLLFAPCVGDGTPMEARKKAKSSAIEQGFRDGNCLPSLQEMPVLWQVGQPAVYYLTPDQLERLQEYADARGEAFVTSESPPPAE